MDKLTGGEGSSTLDKLLQDYFLQKRGQYVASNQLLDQLNKQFGEAAYKYPDDHPLKSKDNTQVSKDIFPFQGKPNLEFAHTLQSIKRDFAPRVSASDYNDMLELDIATA